MTSHNAPSTLGRVARAYNNLFWNEPPEITAETTISELALDAIDRVSFSMELEDEFCVTLHEEDEAQWHTVADIAATMARLIHESQADAPQAQVGAA